MSIHQKKLSGNSLPVPAWRNILEFLPAKEQGACAVASQRLKVIADYDPSADLEKMKARKAITAPPIKAPTSTTPGPSYKFLFSNPESHEERYKISLVQLKMRNNLNVRKTVLDVAKLESYCSPQFIPLYHAVNVPAFALSFLTRELLSSPFLPSEHFPCSIPLIRFPAFDGPKTTKELFAKYPLPPEDSLLPYDKIPEVQKELLSINPHLFANFSQAGESTWYFYAENNSVAAPSTDAFLDMLCKRYDLPVNGKDLKRLKKIHARLSTLALSFARLNVAPEKRETEDPTGMLLQLFVPPSVLDQVGYASLAYGKPDTRSLKSVSIRCESLRQDPRLQPLMQVRLLIQSMFVPDHRITVVSHGCGNFLSDTDPLKLPEVSERDWEKQKEMLQEKHALLHKARQTFLHMISNPILKK